MKKWLAAVAIVALCAGGTAWWNGRVTSGYKRYVSPPLKDGTRYTFLYPARMTGGLPSGPYSSVFKDHSRPSVIDSVTARFTRRLPTTYRLSEVKIVDLVTGNIRRDARNLIDSSPRRLFTRLRDSRANLFVQIEHTDYAGGTVTFAHEKKVVSDSLQVLAPGVSVPSP